MAQIPYDYMKIITAVRSIPISRDVSDPYHSARTQLEHFVFESLNARYGNALNAHMANCKIPKVSDKALVIVERRCHPNLEFVIKNALFFNPGFALHIFCSRANLEFITLILGKHVHDVHIHIVWEGIGTPVEGRVEYNNLLCTRKFWETFTEEHLILFETDCYFLRPVPPTIFDYDYVAAKWAWKPEHAGGGGLSYRKRSVMLDICDRYKPERVEMQDCFASEGVAALGYKTPTFQESGSFFTESVVSDRAVGTHQWWTFLVVICDNVPRMVRIIHAYMNLEV